MNAATSADEIREASRLAGECAVTRDALTLARWAGGQRRQVTASRVLRKADFAEAGALLGLKAAPRGRSMTDIKALNRPWRVAVATGLLSVEAGWAAAGPSLASWPPRSGDLLEGWLAGLRGVCAAESYPRDSGSVQLLVFVLLTVLEEAALDKNGGGRGAARSARMFSALEALAELTELSAEAVREARQASERYDEPGTGRPLAGLIELLSAFGAVSGGARAPRLTVLGRWAAARLRDQLALPAPAGLSAAELVAEAWKYPGWDERSRVARDWLAAREPVAAARELLKAGEEGRPFPRTVAVGLARTLGDAALPAWREAAEWPLAGPHAREMTDAHLTGRDWHWLVAEHAAATLEEFGPDRALTQVWLGMSGDTLKEKLGAVEATHHPGTPELLHALEQFLASGSPRSIDRVAVAKVTLAGVRPPVWRRVHLPVIFTLADLHEVIGELFGSGGASGPVFTVGAKRYGIAGLTGAADSGGPEADADELSLQDAFAAGEGTIGYACDRGAAAGGWRHEITLEKTVPRDPAAEYPVCVVSRGDVPR